MPLFLFVMQMASGMIKEGLNQMMEVIASALFSYMVDGLPAAACRSILTQLLAVLQRVRYHQTA
jgi:hypothetical protein